MSDVTEYAIGWDRAARIHMIEPGHRITLCGLPEPEAGWQWRGEDPEFLRFEQPDCKHCARVLNLRIRRQ